MSLSEAHRRLHDWYRLYGRHDLPWRSTSDPYLIYLSEVMLQQTQVQTVLDRYYSRFLARFPTLASLASASHEEVLTYWEGLGYYRRALYLHQAAKKSGGALPKTIAELMELPGIGRNTAAAIAAFAYRLPVAIMEANVKRIIYRVFARKQASEQELWALAGQLLDSANPYDYNQAMMDLGSLICTPKQPACALCPLAGMCQGRDDPERYPEKTAKKKTPIRHKNIVVFCHQGSYYVTPRTTEFLHGLYSFAEYEPHLDAVPLYNRLYPLTAGARLGEITQTYSHFKLVATIYEVAVGEMLEGEWKTLPEIAGLPLSGADRKIVGLIKKKS